MVFWEFFPEVLGSLWLMASATWGGKSLWLKASMIGEGGPCPFWIIPWHLPCNWGKARKNLSQGSRVAGDYLLRRLGRLFRDSLGWPAEHQSTSVTRGWLQSALGQHRCLPSFRTKGFPASANFESKLLVSALMWSAKNGILRKIDWLVAQTSIYSSSNCSTARSIVPAQATRCH
jgi:hypothetical protein